MLTCAGALDTWMVPSPNLIDPTESWVLTVPLDMLIVAVCGCAEFRTNEPAGAEAGPAKARPAAHRTRNDARRTLFTVLSDLLALHIDRVAIPRRVAGRREEDVTRPAR